MSNDVDCAFDCTRTRKVLESAFLSLSWNFWFSISLSTLYFNSLTVPSAIDTSLNVNALPTKLACWVSNTTNWNSSPLTTVFNLVPLVNSNTVGIVPVSLETSTTISTLALGDKTDLGV